MGSPGGHSSSSSCCTASSTSTLYCSDASAGALHSLENRCFQCRTGLKTRSFRARSEPSFVIKVEARSDVARGQPRERCRLSGRLTAVPTGQPTFDYKNIQDIPVIKIYLTPECGIQKMWTTGVEHNLTP